jgi:hypothetical protein
MAAWLIDCMNWLCNLLIDWLTPRDKYAMQDFLLPGMDSWVGHKK